MGRNGYEVAHYCEVLIKTLHFTLPFGSIWICKYCGKELNKAIDADASKVTNSSNLIVVSTTKR